MSARIPGLPLRGPYAITPDTYDSDHLLALTGSAMAGGVRWLQYRNKTADAALARRQAALLRTLTENFGAKLIINDDIELALAVGADGVHLGRTDGDLASISGLRHRTSELFIIGISCYNDLARAKAAAAAGADYVAFGSVFASSVKPDAVRADAALLRAARASLTLPIIAIGGITLQNAPQLIALGVDAVAVISALFGAADVEAEARSFCQLFVHDDHSQPAAFR